MTRDDLEKAIQFLLDNQARNEAQIGLVGSRLDQLTGNVAELGSRLDQLGGRLDQLGGDVRQLTDLVGRIAESTRVFVERADRRFERIDGRLDRIETVLAEMTDKLNGLIGIVERHVTDESRHRRPGA